MPGPSVQTTAQPAALASSGGRQKPSWVEVCTNTVASLRSRLAQGLPRVHGQVQVLDPVTAPDGEDEVVAARDVVERAEDLEVDARGDDNGRVETHLAQAVAIPPARGDEVELFAVARENTAVVPLAGVVRGLDVLHERSRNAASDARQPHGQGGVPPRCHLDRVHGGELLEHRLVAFEGAHRYAQG